MDDFEKGLHDMFDHIWDCSIDHPMFNDTVGELMEAVIELYKNVEHQKQTAIEDYEIARRKATKEEVIT